MHSHAERGNDRQTALIKAAFPETDDVELTDVEQGRRLPIGQLFLTHTFQNRQFEVVAIALQFFLFKPSNAMHLIGRDPLAKG